MFDAGELAALGELAARHDLILITDEIYDRILYDGRQHRCPGSLEPLRSRTMTLGGLSKTFAITGWRLGYAVAAGLPGRGNQAGARFPHHLRAHAFAGGGSLPPSTSPTAITRP